VARPREKNISKWGYWKRNQRATKPGGRCSRCGKHIKGRADNQHKNNRQSDNSKKNLVKLCRSCHVAIDNKLGRHKKGRR
jgi:hypothetical protein